MANLLFCMQMLKEFPNLSRFWWTEVLTFIWWTRMANLLLHMQLLKEFHNLSRFWWTMIWWPKMAGILELIIGIIKHPVVPSTSIISGSDSIHL
jgi:hypothetical protein